MALALIVFLPWKFACQGSPESTVLKGVFGLNEEPRWSNSGTVLGSVAAMRSLYGDLLSIFEQPDHQTGSDQGNNAASSFISAIR